YAPGAYGQKHGHLNSAVFYVLKGRGHDVHDGRHIPWKAGDVMIVENGCVHQHFNDDPENEAILLVFKAKPLFLFMHLLFQKIVEGHPDKWRPGQASYNPPTDIRGERAMPFEDKGPALSGAATCTFYADDVAASQNFRKQYETRTNVVKAQDMPWERSAD